MSNVKQVFAMGWEAGRRRGEVTPRQAERLLRGLLCRIPEAVEVDIFCNGSVDGQVGDRWRLDG